MMTSLICFTSMPAPPYPRKGGAEGEGLQHQIHLHPGRLSYGILFLLPVLLVLVGCAGASALMEEVPDDYGELSASQVVERMSAAVPADISSISSRARVTIRSPQQNNSGAANFRQLGSDTLWASVQGPLNYEVARALVTADSFYFHDRLRGQLLLGSSATAQQLFPGPISLDEIMQSMTGTLIPDSEHSWVVTYSDQAGAHPLWLTARDGSVRMAVDPQLWRVRRYERLASGEIVDRRVFDDFRPVHGVLIPHRIELENPQIETYLLIEYRRVTLNPDTLDFPFSTSGIPRHYLD